MKNVLRIGIAGTLVFAPFAAFAVERLDNILRTFNNLIATATPIVVAFALLGFFWGLAIYIFNAGDEKKKSQGRNIMIWGVLALFVMLSVFGIIGVLQTTLGVQNVGIPIPSVRTNTGGGPNNFGP